MATLKSGRDSAVVLAELATAQANLAAIDLATPRYTNSAEGGAGNPNAPDVRGFVSSQANTHWAAVTHCRDLQDELDGVGIWMGNVTWPWGGVFNGTTKIS